jgi:hypothetical protein
MKKKIIYSICAVLLVVAGCTKFDEDTPIPFVKGPGVTITNVVVTDTTIAFTVAPDATAGYYSYLLVAGKNPAALDSSRVLKLSYDGLTKATVNYADATSKNVLVEKLTPNTAYLIYAVAANANGMAGAVASQLVSTGDNGDAPAPKTVDIADSTIAVTFSEPIVRGEGVVSVTFHALNAQTNPAYNPTVAVPDDSISVEGAELYINLPPHPALGRVPAGAFVTVTYEAGAVKDLSGIACAAFTNTGVFDPDLGFSGITARMATATWGFKPVEAEVLTPIVDWVDGQLTITPDSTMTAPIAGRAKPYQLIYKEAGKTTVIDATGVGYSSGRDIIFLRTNGAEMAKRGAIIDAGIPAGAFVDYFGNANIAFAVEDIYIYSYGYDKDDVLGTYNVALQVVYGASSNNTETGIVIENYGDGSSNTVLVKNLFATGSELKAVFDGVLGTLSIPGDQLLTDAFEDESEIYEVYFYNADDPDSPMVFNVPTAGTITSSTYWGYYYINVADEEDQDWYNVFLNSTWTRQP